MTRTLLEYLKVRQGGGCLSCGIQENLQPYKNEEGQVTAVLCPVCLGSTLWNDVKIEESSRPTIQLRRLRVAQDYVSLIRKGISIGEVLDILSQEYGLSKITIRRYLSKTKLR